MNWYAHAVVAEEQTGDPACVLGAMLPDLAAAVGARVAPAREGGLADGLRLHAAADAAFHAAPAFAALVADGRAALETAGLARGGARGAAHVGIELLLDGWLAERRGRSAIFAAALALAAPLAAEPRLFRSAPDPARWLELCARLRTGAVPEGYARPERAALGVERALSRRPRLALANGDRVALEAWLAEMKAPVAACAPALLACAAAARP
jgi:hypothetical protein